MSNELDTPHPRRWLTEHEEAAYRRIVREVRAWHFGKYRDEATPPPPTVAVIPLDKHPDAPLHVQPKRTTDRKCKDCGEPTGRVAQAVRCLKCAKKTTWRDVLRQRLATRWAEQRVTEVAT